MALAEKPTASTRTLSAFALILLTVSLVHAQERRFEISQMGAVGDGATIDTAAIQAVIDRAAEAGGGTVDNITYRNIELQNTLKTFEFNMAWRMVNAKPPSDPLPIVRNVNIINVSGTVENVGDMTGLADGPISNVRLENTDIRASGAGLILRMSSTSTSTA